jgi:hypothetical protein
LRVFDDRHDASQDPQRGSAYQRALYLVRQSTGSL